MIYLVTAFKRICSRCGATFSVDKSGKHTRREECNYHYGKVIENRGKKGLECLLKVTFLFLALSIVHSVCVLSQCREVLRRATVVVRMQLGHLDAKCSMYFDLCWIIFRFIHSGFVRGAENISPALSPLFYAMVSPWTGFSVVIL